MSLTISNKQHFFLTLSRIRTVCCLLLFVSIDLIILSSLFKEINEVCINRMSKNDSTTECTLYVTYTNTVIINREQMIYNLKYLTSEYH